MAHDVADDQHRVAVGLQERVVPVAADRDAPRRRPVAHGQLAGGRAAPAGRAGCAAAARPPAGLAVGQPGVVQRQRRPAGGDLGRPQLGVGVRPALGPVDQGERAEQPRRGRPAGTRRRRPRLQRLQRRPRLGAGHHGLERAPAVKSRDDHRPVLAAAAVGTGAVGPVGAPPAGRRSGASPRPAPGPGAPGRRPAGVPSLDHAHQAPVGQQRHDQIGEAPHRLVGVEGRGHRQVDVAEQHQVPAGLLRLRRRGGGLARPRSPRAGRPPRPAPPRCAGAAVTSS